MQYSPEQQAILAYAANPTKHVVCPSLAGTGKTTAMLGAIAELPPPKKYSQIGYVLSLSFNKKISTEITERVSADPKLSGRPIENRTLNSLGAILVKNILGSYPKLQSNKVMASAKAYGKLYDLEKEEVNNLASAVNTAKSYGYVPQDFTVPGKSFESLTSYDDLVAVGQDFSCPKDTLDFLLSEDLSLSFLYKTIDFTDQLYLPAIMTHCSTPDYEYIFVDEAQDLSILTHNLLGKMLRSSPGCKLFAFGDKYQGIYAFRGADRHSMENLGALGDFETFPLTYSYRVSKAVLKEANKFVPELKTFNETVGSVTHQDNILISDLPSGSAVICRNNAPLMLIAAYLFKSGLPVRFADAPFAAMLYKYLEYCKPFEHKGVEAAQAKLATYKKVGVRLQEIYECLDIILRQADGDFGKAKAMLVALSKETNNTPGAIHLCTGHKAKGLEWDTVYLLDFHLLNHKKEPQDFNLAYVMITRSKHDLIYITSKGVDV